MYKAFTFSVSRANNCLTLALVISLSWGCYELCKKSNLQWGLLFISQQWWVSPLWMLNCHNTPVLLCCCLVSLWAVIPMNCPFTKKKIKKNFVVLKGKGSKGFLALFHGQHSFGMCPEMTAACRWYTLSLCIQQKYYHRMCQNLEHIQMAAVIQTTWQLR